MDKINLASLRQMKQQGEKIAVLTAYDASFATVLDAAGVDVLLVGDSLGMVVQGQPTTLPVSIDEMIYHTANVCRGNRNALVMTDIEMPRMDGFTLTEHIRNLPNYSDVPIVLVTSLERESDKQRGIQVGADAYITKGDFGQSQLVETVKSLIHGGRIGKAT